MSRYGDQQGCDKVGNFKYGFEVTSVRRKGVAMTERRPSLIIEEQATYYGRRGTNRAWQEIRPISTFPEMRMPSDS